MLSQGSIPVTTVASSAVPDVTILDATQDSNPGRGWLCFTPHEDSPGGYFCWIDPRSLTESGRLMNCNFYGPLSLYTVDVQVDGTYLIWSPELGQPSLSMGIVAGFHR